MRFLFITLFPEQIEQAAGHSIIKRAVDAGLVEVSCINPRDFATDRHRTVDDTPFGGGAGMVLKPEPMVAAIRMAKQQLPAARVIAMCPGGRTLKQDIVEEYARSGQDLILVCGHYEGFDERIFNWVDEKLSIGDYVLTGGELPALIVMDAVARFIPGVLGKMASAVEDSFSTGLLEYPQYTRPEVYEGKPVPEVLLSGHHKNIESWRREQSIRRTLERRPDLLEDASLTLKEQKFLDSLLKEQGESRLKELEQLVREAVKSDETPGSDREYYQQMKKVKKLPLKQLLNEKKATLQELKGYYKVLGALKQEI